MNNEEAIKFGKEQLEIFGEDSRMSEFIRMSIQALEERPKGKWIEVDNGLVSGRCSLCGWEAVIMETDVCGMPFCPNCGADMRGDV